jgi:hypothetical protein
MARVYQGYVCNDGTATYWVSEGDLVAVDGVDYVRVGSDPNWSLVPFGGAKWRYTHAEAMRDVAQIITERAMASLEKAEKIRRESMAGATA